MVLTNPPTSFNVFVTGAATPLGRDVTRRLVARGHKVTGLTQGSTGAAKVRQDGGIPAFSDPYRAGELKSIMRSAQTDVVLHLATQAAHGFPRRESTLDNRSLSQGTTALLDAAGSSGARFIVYPSFTFLYGDQHGEWVDENSRRHEEPLFVAALNAEDRVLQSALPACVLRAGTLYGPEDEGTQSLAERLRRGRGVYLGDGHSYQNWVQITDLAQAVVLAAEQMPEDQLFNVVDDEPAPAAEFVGYLASSLGLPAPGSRPGLIVDALTRDLQRVLLNTSIRARNDKIKQTLGWKPRYPTYRAGLDQTLLIWRAEEPVHA